ncbi:hypothetical protein [Caulobacter sp. DWP3-1-3b2]|uniref:hypothetical protein n=1 Tax=Caulobacter sp. DWP3-1-3b2 TaxID=2804643 RepID=UPI003CE88ACC
MMLVRPHLFAALCVLTLCSAAPVDARNLGQDDSLGRAAATDVVVFDVLKVRPLQRGEVATCRVYGRAIKAERGARFKPRQSVRLTVPCAAQGAGSSDSTPKWIDREALVRSAHGRAFLASDGALIAYELYDLD